MATSYTTLLGLALPVQGELQGTWGDEVNNYITNYLDAAVAGTQNISTDADVTLTKTTGTALTGTSSQYSILLFSGSRAAQRTVTVPAASKSYVVINATTGGFAVKVVGVGPTTGVTIANGEKAVIAWNGSDFVRVAAYGGTGEFTTVDTTNLQVTNIKAKDGTASATIANSTGVMTIASSVLTTADINGGTMDNVVIGGSTRAAGNFTNLDATGTLVVDGNTTLGDSSADSVTINGTVAPGVVIAGASSGDALRITQTGAGNALVVEDSTNPDATPFVIDTSGNVGIGVGSPTALLHVYSSSATIARFERSSVSNTALQATDGTNSVYFGMPTGGGFAVDDDADLANAPWLYIDTSGNVGIGTTSPGAKLNVVANTSSDAVRITQTGSGNALLVEDGANPDATPFVIDATGRVIVGSTASLATGIGTPQLHTVGSSVSLAMSATTIFSNDTAGSNYVLGKSRGSLGTVGTIVSSGDFVGNIFFVADDGASLIRAASISAVVDGTPGTNDMPGRLVFSTTADGASTPTERYRINSAGIHFFGNTTTNTNSTLMVVNGEISETTSGTQYKLASQYDIGTGPNDIPLNQYLGTMAFQDADAVSVGYIRSNATTGSGYALGAGSTVTQITSRTTGVTINAACGAITLVSAAGTTTPDSFTVTNSSVAATDVIILNQKSGTDKYVLLVTAVAAGSFEITAYTTGGTTTEQPVINFAVIKAVTA